MTAAPSFSLAHTTPFALEAWFTELTSAYPQLDLSLGNSGVQGRSLGTILELAEPAEREAFFATSLDYSARNASGALAVEVADWLGLEPEQVLLTSGASEALFLVLNTQVASGDVLLVERPSYQPLFQPAEDRGAHIRSLPLSSQEGWRLPAEGLEELTAGVRLVCLNRPHNPTGATATPLELRRYLAACHQCGARLLTDDVYRELAVEPPDLLASLDAGVISVGGLSKPFGLGGLRIGWIACRDDAVIHEARLLRDYITLAPSAAAQQIGLLVVRHREALLEQTHRLLTTNRQVMQSFLEQHEDAVSGNLPAVGCIGFFQLEAGQSTRDTCLTIAREANVLLLPGEVFGMPGYVRLGYGADSASLTGALNRLSDWLASSAYVGSTEKVARG